MYADFAVCQAANYRTGDIHGLLLILLIYDIACQWAINFHNRVQQNPSLTFPGLSQRLLVAVGKFHLGVHVKSCFWKHSLNFISGAGHLDGEIMETIWSQMNGIAATTRSMTHGHRWEVLNDFMGDFNFKKLVSMGECMYPYLLSVLTYPQIPFCVEGLGRLERG